MDSEKKILDLITQELTWEEVIYRIVALENLNPWDLDLNLLAKSFVKYISKFKELDFRIPAKWIIVACMLLRMKSDHLKFIKEEEELQEVENFEELGLDMETGMGTEMEMEKQPEFEISLALPLKRRHVRKITVKELVNSLRKVLNSEERREDRKKRIASRIKISQIDVTKRIDELYKRISDLLDKIKEEEVRFSNLIKKWEKGEVVNTFLPLIYLDDQKKVNCRQEKIFDEIYIRKR